MKPVIILLLWLAADFAASAQENVKLYNRDSSGVYIVMADNMDYCPVSVEVTYTLTNMKSSAGKKQMVVLPSRSKENRLSKLSVTNENKASRMSYTTRIFYGDCSSDRYDSLHAYHLPYEKGKAFPVSQGYNGKRTHQGENALDFDMPEGTAVCAIRDGVVFEIVSKNSRNCPQRDCIKYNNYIRIVHSDGTMAEYTHLKKNGTTVQPGDSVKTGQVIGYSGNTGYSTGPHLHVVVRQCSLDNKKTVKTLFITGDGTSTEYLKEKNSYRKDY